MENSPLTCPFCKSEIEPGASACEVCGRSLSDAIGTSSLKEESPSNLVQDVQTLLSGSPRIDNQVEKSEGEQVFGRYPTESAPASPKQVIILVAIVVAVSCVLVLGGVVVFQFVKSRFNEQASIATQTAEVLSRDTRRTEVAAEQTKAWADYAARSTQEAFATESAYTIQLLLAEAKSWPVVFEDDFSTDSETWYVEEGDDEYSYYSYSIQEGVYLVDMTAKQGMSQWLWPDIIDTSLESFYLAADLRMEGPASIDGGLVFHLGGEDDRDFYLFDISKSGEIGVYLHSQSGWTLLTDYIYAGSFAPDGVNRIEIIGRPADDGLGRDYDFFINGTWVLSMNDNTLDGGWVGVQVGLSEEGDNGIWRFDNVVLRAP